jgi:acetylornithine deacetylase/succinyl-diaminopimelate desuccinylase-like protein
MRSHNTLAALAFAAALLPAFAAEPRLAKDHQARVREIFRELIEIKSTHDAGTTLVAEAIARRLRAAGYTGDDLKILAPQKGKENLIARLHGNGAAKPILFIAHLDVVEAKPEDWTVDPFAFTEKDGYFYGRGATDIKDEAAELIENFIRLREENFKPAGDYILALTADEEAGGLLNGVDWLVKNHRPLIDAAFCVNTDGGGGEIKRGKYIAMPVQTAEKVYLSFKLELTDKGGHSSIPTKANPIFRLAEALARLSKFEFPIHVNDTIRGYFAAMAEMENGPAVADMKAIAADPSNWPAAERLCAAMPYYNALLRTTATATLISGGHAENALPQLATATVNCRILPEESANEIEATLKRVLADNSIVLTRIEPAKPSPSSPVDPRIFDAVKKITREMWPAAAVMPIMMTGATDGLYLRGAGIPVYGISGMFSDVEDPRAHGKDERIGVTDFYDGVEFMYRLMKLLARSN